MVPEMTRNLESKWAIFVAAQHSYMHEAKSSRTDCLAAIETAKNTGACLVKAMGLSSETRNNQGTELPIIDKTDRTCGVDRKQNFKWLDLFNLCERVWQYNDDRPGRVLCVANLKSTDRAASKTSRLVLPERLITWLGQDRAKASPLTGTASTTPKHTVTH
jgi:hypothetical protein